MGVGWDGDGDGHGLGMGVGWEWGWDGAPPRTRLVCVWGDEEQAASRALGPFCNAMAVLASVRKVGNRENVCKKKKKSKEVGKWERHKLRKEEEE